MRMINYIRHHVPPVLGWLIILKGVVSFIFGNLAFFQIPKDTTVTDIQQAFFFWHFSPNNALTAIIIGLAFIALGRGIYQGRRFAWYIAMILLCFNFVDNIYPHIIFFQALYVLLLMLLLAICRPYFTKSANRSLSTEQVIGIVIIIFSMAYGVVGCYLLRDEYHGIHNWFDAIYYSLETYSTIGYGDITPLTMNARVFTCTMIIFGVGGFLTAITVLFGTSIERRVKKVVTMVNKLNIPKNHIIIAGATTLGVYLAKILADQGNAIIIIDSDPSAIKTAEEADHKVILTGLDPEKDLIHAGIKTAKTLLCVLNTDAQNIMMTMVGNKLRHEYNVGLQIITRVDLPHTEYYATQNGADQVISTITIIGDQVLKTLG